MAKKKTAPKPLKKLSPKKKAIRGLTETELNSVRGGGKIVADAKKWG